MVRRSAALLLLLTCVAPAGSVAAHGSEDVHAGAMSVEVVGPGLLPPCENAFAAGTQVRVRGEGFQPSSRITVTFASPVDGMVTYPTLISTVDGLIDVDLVLPQTELEVATVGLLVAKGPGPDGHDPVLSARVPLQSRSSLCGERLEEYGAIVGSSGTARVADSDRPVLRVGGAAVVSQENATATRWPVYVAGATLLCTLAFLAYAAVRRARR